MKVALIQSQLLWEDPEANRRLFSEKIKTVSGDADLIVLPEMFTTGFTMNPGHIHAEEGMKTVEWMQSEAKKYSAALVGSIVFQEDGHFYNRLYFVEPDGSTTAYDKRHTFTLAGEDKVYKKGADKIVHSYKGFLFCPLICYDLRFPVWSRNVEGYDALIYVANWPKPRINAWDALLKARAIENMAYCIGVNRIGLDGDGYEYPGHSATYDVLGDRLAYSEKEEIIYTTLSKQHIETNRKKLMFLEDRDDFTLK